MCVFTFLFSLCCRVYIFFNVKTLRSPVGDVHTFRVEHESCFYSGQWATRVAHFAFRGSWVDAPEHIFYHLEYVKAHVSSVAVTPVAVCWPHKWPKSNSDLLTYTRREREMLRVYARYVSLLFCIFHCISDSFSTQFTYTNQGTCTSSGNPLLHLRLLIIHKIPRVWVRERSVCSFLSLQVHSTDCEALSLNQVSYTFS